MCVKDFSPWDTRPKPYIGFHDYLAMPTEREREAKWALRRSLAQPGDWVKFLLPGAIFAVVLITVIVAAVVWCKQG